MVKVFVGVGHSDAAAQPAPRKSDDKPTLKPMVEILGKMIDILSNMNKQLTKLADTLSNMHERLTKLNNELQRDQAAMLAMLATQLAASRQPAPQPRPRPSLPDPFKLGKAGMLDVWLLQMEGKMRIDGDAIGSPEVQFYYVLGQLKTRHAEGCHSCSRLCRGEQALGLQRYLQLSLGYL
ncbi:hypothetical protein F5Y04DRAFT_116805 [Hypomontagnella monticulosa]|nr:hypothetical protein F5Y04DRAFT_116805 [Hypomontagnella monticulosa]